MRDSPCKRKSSTCSSFQNSNQDTHAFTILCVRTATTCDMFPERECGPSHTPPPPIIGKLCQKSERRFKHLHDGHTKNRFQSVSKMYKTAHTVHGTPHVVDATRGHYEECSIASAPPESASQTS